MQTIERELSASLNPQENTQMKGIGLWLLGVPVIVIVALYVFGIM